MMDASPTPCVRRPLVVCVDDEEYVLHALRRLFRDAPVEVLTTRSPEEAALLTERNGARFVIADHRMPGTTGIQLLRRIAAQSPRTIRVLLTAHADADVFEACIGSGVHHFFTKPWDGRQLRNFVLKLIHEQFPL
jgi:response regulator RpfG family c-di-GMP phosphodiesterase